MQKKNLRGLDLNLLVPLQVLLEERSVTKTAMRVHLSQPAMSRAFERLREAFSDDLLIRSGKKYALTPRAAALLEELTLLLPKVESLWQMKPFSPASASGSLKLDAFWVCFIGGTSPGPVFRRSAMAGRCNA